MESNPMCMALSAVKVLRLEVGNLFSTLSAGVKEEHGEEGREFISEIQSMLSAINHRYRELEQTVNNIKIPPGSLMLSNSSYFAQENSTDKQNLYSPLVRSHKWSDKVHKYSAFAHSILNANSLKKSIIFTSNNNKRKRPQTASHNISPQTMEAFIASMDRMFKDMNIQICRAFTTSTVVQVTLGRILQATVALKGFVIEWVVVRGYTESCNSPADLMSESRYHVFRRISDHAQAATLHFADFAMPIAMPNVHELATKSFLTWLHSYSSLFTNVCKQCGKHSYDCYPPTWRDFKNCDPYHFECKP
ncbi:mediator of RNA polymerase II transcription subunit 27-like [Planococcus citri]|uniref:mediator of RNA polymerase II transcription subunit 27-like n=1 Tax=Planococcus citri TaxID=170843 RepID=UPI0031F80BE3